MILVTNYLELVWGIIVFQFDQGYWGGVVRSLLVGAPFFLAVAPGVTRASVPSYVFVCRLELFRAVFFFALLRYHNEYALWEHSKLRRCAKKIAQSIFCCPMRYRVTRASSSILVVKMKKWGAPPAVPLC